MPRVAYVNGRYVRHADAAVHIEDRGYQFADAIYEVIAVVGGRRVDETLHLDRLERSLGEIHLDVPWSRSMLCCVMDELLRRNRLRKALVYIQISRGTAPREHAFPANSRPSLVMTVRASRDLPEETVRSGVKIVTIDDLRWKRADIKSVSLLPNVMAKQQAKIAGAFEAWQVDGDGMVTEGTSTNAWIVTKEGAVVTRPADENILNGVTRRTLLAIARDIGLKIDERPFSRDEAHSAAEAFLTSTSSLVLPVSHIDSTPIGDGRPGPMTLKLLDNYRTHVAEEAGR